MKQFKKLCIILFFAAVFASGCGNITEEITDGSDCVPPLFPSYPQQNLSDPKISEENCGDNPTESPLPDEPEENRETDLQPSVDLPQKIHTNITDPNAIQILSAIFDFAAASTNVSVFYTDTDEEFHFGIEEEKTYHSASTIKAVYCQYLLSSNVDLEEKILFALPNRTSASGKLTPDKAGTLYSVGDLIEYAIRSSDNQAYRLLFENFGIEGYNQYVTSIGIPEMMLSPDSEWAVITSGSLSKAMVEIYKYGQTNSFLVDHMMNTDYNKQIASGTSYPTAHKYGWNGENNGFHDTAIIYAPERSYVLTILTHIDANTTNSLSVFREITSLCETLNGILCRK